MIKNKLRAVALALGTLTATAVVPDFTAAPAQAAPATAETKAAGVFIDQLADKAFAILRDKSLSRAQVKANFRQMLRDNFAVQQIGDRLIRRYRSQITPQQYAAYMAAFPDYVVDTYADRLFEYANSDLRVIRTLPRGSRGDIDVMTRITIPNQAQPLDATWAVKKAPDGRFQVTNLTVAGVNLALTQEADFASFIQRRGFDALVEFMKNGGGKA